MNIVLDYVAENICAESLKQINKWVDDKTREQGGIRLHSATKVPEERCTSINDEVCHGIPSEDVILKEGDIISVVFLRFTKDISPGLRVVYHWKTAPDKRTRAELKGVRGREGIRRVKPLNFLGIWRMQSTVMQRKGKRL